MNKYTIPFVGNILEPIGNIWCIAFCLSIWCINFLWRSINIFCNDFSNLPEFTLSWVDQATFRVDIEVVIMVFYCYVGWFVYIIFFGKVYGIQNIGFYRVDGLACLRKISRPASDKIWKDMIRTFWENSGLRITTTANLKTVNFLDVTFNLCTGKYQLYNKPNNTPTYINFNTIRLISSRHCQIAFHNE